MNDNLDPQTEVRRLLAEMTIIAKSSPDSLTERYAAMRDLSYQLAIQVRTAAMPDPYARTEAFVSEVTGRKW